MKWLTAEELDSWLSVVRLMTWLPWSIDQQLQRDSKLGMVEYQVMAMLSESPQRTMRMSSLAEVTNASLVPVVARGHTPRGAEGWCAASRIRRTGGSPMQSSPKTGFKRSPRPLPATSHTCVPS